MKKVYFTLIMLVVFTLTACQGTDQTLPNNAVPSEQESNTNNASGLNDEPQSNDSGNSSKNNSDDSSKNGQQPVNSRHDSDQASDSSSNPVHEETGLVKKTEYATKKEAVNAIEDYYKVEQSNVDLGHGIKGFSEGAAGHQYISWNEGKWLIEVNFPSDPEYAVDGYENGEAMAKSIVSYLEDHFLPPPDERGKIEVNGFQEHPETVIQWQEGKNVYTIDQKTADPLEVLQVAVDYEANNK